MDRQPPTTMMLNDPTPWIPSGDSPRLIDFLNQTLAQTPQRAQTPSDSAIAASNGRLDAPGGLGRNVAQRPQSQIQGVPAVGLPEYLFQVSATFSLPIETAATLWLGIVSSVVARKWVVCPRDDWHEPVNLYCLSAARPGAGKSAVLGRLLRPIEEEERRLEEIARVEKARDDSERRAKRERQKSLERKLGASSDPEADDLAELEQIAVELEQPEVVLPVLHVSDITSESMSTVLFEQGEKMLYASGECGALLEEFAGRYKQGARSGGGSVGGLDVWLKAYSGDAHRIVRRGRNEHLRRPAISIACCAQPSLIRKLLNNSAFSDRGLGQRFLISDPPSNRGYSKLAQKPIDRAVMKEYSTRFEALIREAERIEDDPDGEWCGARVVVLDEEADELFVHIYEQSNLDQRDGGRLCDVDGFASKAVGTMLRVALILEVWRNPSCRAIGVEALRMAHAVMEYFTQERLRHSVSDTDQIIEEIKTYVSDRAATSVSKRDLFNAIRKRCKAVTVADDLDNALGLMVDVGMLDECDPKQGQNRRRRVFDVWPGLWGGTKANHDEWDRRIGASDGQQ